VIDGSVLAAGVHCLQADQQRVPPFRVEEVLQFAQLLLVMRNLLGRLRVVRVMVFERRIDVFELDARSWGDPEPLQIAHYSPPSGTGQGAAPQIPAAYSAMARSLENLPEQPTLWIAIRAHVSLSR